jgi:mannitol PTS system EIIA component
VSDILRKENIFAGCPAQPKEDIIREAGRIFVAGGYTQENYIQFMLDKEKQFDTAIGNQLAIPHGTEEGKAYVLHPGIVIMTFPKGTIWNGKIVRLVIVIAASGDEHVDILSNIAVICSDVAEVDKIVRSTADQIYMIFAGTG